MIWHREFDSGWQSWASLGGLTTAPPAETWRSNVLDVFVRGMDGALWHQPFTGTAPSAWESLGGLIVGAPATASSSSTRVDVFAEGTDGALWHRMLVGSTWTPWESLGGVLLGSPAVASTGSGRLDVFAPGKDQARSGTAPSSAARGRRGNRSVASSSAALPRPRTRQGDSTSSSAGPTPDCGTDRWRPGAEAVMGNLGGQLRSDPTAESPVAGTVRVAVGGTDGDSWYRLSDGSPWTPWQPLGAAV